MNLKFGLDNDGFAIFSNCLDHGTVERLRADFSETRGPDRNILSVQSVRALATSHSVREIVEKILGPECFAVRGIFFNKTRQSNWKVVWHQDLTIAVREQHPVIGFGPWTTKAGIWHVQPPSEIMSGMLAIRLHLDESDSDNGPLRVIPSTHKHGRLSVTEIATLAKNDCVTCTVPEGGALVMRRLLLHASSACLVNKPRRVIHLEFAAQKLSHGLSWYHEVGRKSAG
jgi:ectoine hydroxylase-related dioxygenase (phytanoyl-CoA dioxygenase family)